MSDEQQVQPMLLESISPVAPVARGQTPSLARARRWHEHNCDTDTEQGKAALMATAGQATYHWENMPREDMVVRYWRVHEKEPEINDDGEEGSKYRMVLVCTNGVTFSTGSASAIDVLALAVETYGHEPWDPPLVFTAKRGRTNKRKEFCQLECKGRMQAQTNSK